MLRIYPTSHASQISLTSTALKYMTGIIGINSFNLESSKCPPHFVPETSYKSSEEKKRKKKKKKMNTWMCVKKRSSKKGLQKKGLQKKNSKRSSKKGLFQKNFFLPSSASGSSSSSFAPSIA